MFLVVTVIVVVPKLTPVTSPDELTMAIELSLVVHVRFFLEAYTGVKVGVSVTVAPFAMPCVSGSEMDVGSGAHTVMFTVTV